MIQHILQRLLFGALTMLSVSNVAFIIMRILPGDPLVVTFGPDGFTRLSDEQRAHFMAEPGLSDPLPMRYLHWIQEILRGNLGHSFFRSESVADMLLIRGLLTAQIGFLSVLLSWLVGIPVAVVSKLRPNSLANNVARLLSILFLAVSGFRQDMLVALGLLLAFSYRQCHRAPV